MPEPRHHALHFLPATLLFVATVHGQVQQGDIGIAGLSSTTFKIASPGQVVTSYVTAGFGGTSQAILHDPANFNDFLIGGNGFIGRATVTGPGTSNWAPLAASVTTVAQMSWDLGGQLIVADGGTDQVVRVDPVTGATTPLTIGAQPWGTTLNAGAYDRALDRVVLGGANALYELDLSSAATVATLLVGGITGTFNGVTFDPLTSEVIATIANGPTTRMIRVSFGGTITDVTSSFAGMNAVDIDQNGDFITTSINLLFRVPLAGGTLVNLGNNVASITGVSVARGGGWSAPFGQACAGATGTVALRAIGPFSVGNTLTLTSTNHAPSSLGVLVFGFSSTTYLGLPLPFSLDATFGTNGCFAHVSPDVPVVGFTGATTPAELAFSLPLTTRAAGTRLLFQHVVFEPVAGGMSWSNGLAVQID